MSKNAEYYILARQKYLQGASSQEIAAYAKTLSEMGEELENTIAKFKIS